MVPVFKNVGEWSTTKNYRTVSLLFVVGKLVNNRIVDHLEKYGLFSDFQYGFMSSRSTADLLTVVSDRIARDFNRSGVTRAVALDSAEFGMLARYLLLFLLFSVIGGFGWFWKGNLYKTIQLMLEFLKAPFLVLHFSYHTLKTFLMMLSAILLSMLMILLSTLNVIRYLICGIN